jgi:hypothetical protein
MNFKTNRWMQLAYPQGLESLVAPLPDRLQEILASGVIEIGPCVFLKALAEGAHASADDFPDVTGYECFVNHVHIEDYARTNMTAIGVTLLCEISLVLRQRFPERSFRGIIADDENSCTVRFHTVRLGEQWLLDDLDEYEGGVGITDL